MSCATFDTVLHSYININIGDIFGLHSLTELKACSLLALYHCAISTLETFLACSQSQYEKKLQAHGVNTIKYWLVEVIENDCIVTQVGVYDEKLPEPSGNPSGSALGISL